MSEIICTKCKTHIQVTEMLNNKDIEVIDIAPICDVPFASPNFIVWYRRLK